MYTFNDRSVLRRDDQVIPLPVAIERHKVFLEIFAQEIEHNKSFLKGAEEAERVNA
jgi:hypothetical protein